MATKSMTEKNRAFWSLPKAKQRVAVAKDVIASFKVGFYKAKTGSYFRVIDLKNPIEDPPEKLDATFNMLKKKGASCQVCGIGACFTSMVKIGDKTKTENFLWGVIDAGDGISDTPMRTLLRKVFTSKQLTLIECAFEIDLNFEDSYDNVPYTERKKAESFGGKFFYDKQRLIAIMDNIIKNKGKFIP